MASKTKICMICSHCTDDCICNKCPDCKREFKDCMCVCSECDLRFSECKCYEAKSDHMDYAECCSHCYSDPCNCCKRCGTDHSPGTACDGEEGHDDHGYPDEDAAEKRCANCNCIMDGYEGWGPHYCSRRCALYSDNDDNDY